MNLHQPMDLLIHVVRAFDDENVTHVCFAELYIYMLVCVLMHTHTHLHYVCLCYSHTPMIFIYCC
jgi:hypothetical protein